MAASLFLTDQVSFVVVFLEGLLSFLSPCVLPLIPLYMSYLAGSGKVTDSDGRIRYKRNVVFWHTFFFILGISFAFAILGFSITTVGRYLGDHKTWLVKLGGVLIMLLGLFQLGVFRWKPLEKERKIKFSLGNKAMNPLIAFVMGFTFSFAWTPCVGPALSSVLILAANAGTAWEGYLLVGVYSLGFLIPFMLLGLFTGKMLNLLKGKQKILKYTVKVGAILLIIIGFLTFTGWMGSLSKYVSGLTGSSTTETTSQSDETDATTEETREETTAGEEASTLAAFDFTLTDQYGNVHTLSEYKGKVVFLNFWATWCGPCQNEMPDVESLYQEYGLNQEDVIVLGVANPASDAYPQNYDVSQEEILEFLDEYALTFPVVFDVTGDVVADYYISSLPTTYVIDRDGNIAGYAQGMLYLEQMENAIDQMLEK